MKKLFIAAMAAVMMCAAAGCESHDDHSHANMVGDAGGENGNLAQEDMPYGATIYELHPEYDDRLKYTVEFDKRYFGGDGETEDLREIYLVHDYIVAVNENDHEKIKNLYYPGFLEHLCVSGGYTSADEYLDGMNTSLKNTLGEDFVIDYINISDCLTEGEEANNFFNFAAAEIATFDSSLFDKITSQKVVEIGGYTCYKAGGKSYVLEKHTEPFNLRIYQVDGEYYLF